MKKFLPILVLLPLLYSGVNAQQATTNLVTHPSYVGSPLVGLAGGLNPWDAPQTHDLLRFILNGNSPTNSEERYSKWCLDWQWWMKGTPNTNWLGGSGQAYYDRFYSLNSQYRQIIQISNCPTNELAAFSRMIVKRYNSWAWMPVCEDGDVNRASATIKIFRAAVPANTRIVGPDYPNDFNPGYYDTMVTNGTMSLIDVVTGHDYFGCVYNGSSGPVATWNSLPFDPADQRAGGSKEYPDMSGRFAWLCTYTNKLRNVLPGPKVMCTEFGIYNRDPRGAAAAAAVALKYNITLLISSPQSPIDNFPYSQTIYNPVTGAGRLCDSMVTMMNIVALVQGKL